MTTPSHTVGTCEVLGMVQFFHVRRGFGRIRTDRHPEGVFAHFSEVAEEAQILVPNELVSLQVVQGPRGSVAKNISRVSPRIVGKVQSSHHGQGYIRSHNGLQYRFHHEDLLKGQKRYSRLEGGWQVQFSPWQGESGPEAKEIVICDTRPLLQQQVKLDPWESRLKQLALMAQPEPWDDPASGKPLGMLENYLFESYRKLESHGAVMLLEEQGRDKVALWNSGLLTAHGEEILIRMEALGRVDQPRGYLTRPSWRIGGIYQASDRRIPFLKNPLPIAADFMPGRHVLPDPLIPWTTDLDHLMHRHLRLPMPQVPAQEQLQRLEGCLRQLQRQCKRDPRLAIPQWYDDEIQYLLPLDFGQGPVAAFVLAPSEGQLRVQTILQLSWAWQNARLLGPVENSWLAEWRVRST